MTEAPVDQRTHDGDVALMTRFSSLFYGRQLIIHSPVQQYHAPIRKACSFFLYQPETTSMKSGEIPDSKKPRKNRCLGMGQYS